MMNKNALKVLMMTTSILILTGVQQSVNAAIFKCVNDEGGTYYNDKACPKTDEETQFNNIKDPEGGYIPPAFKEVDKGQMSKGVVVGEEKDTTNNSNRSEDVSGSEDLNSTSGNNSSASNNSNTDIANEDIIESSYSGTGKRTKPKSAAKKPLPTIPLKVETVTLEPRSKIN